MAKVTRKSKTLNVRSLIILSLSLLVIAFVLYKFFEWKTFSDLSSSYNTAYFDEIKFVSVMEPSNADYYTQLNNGSIKNAKNSTEYLKALGTAEAKLDIVINNEEGYLDLITRKLTLFSQIASQTNLLLGERGDIGKKIVNDQILYYQDEIKSTNIYLASLYGTKILFSIYKDNVALNDFSKSVGSSTNASFIAQYFGNITSLEKYSNDNFKFDKEDFVNNYYPNFVSKIDNWKKYFSSYYTAEKDFTAGNTDAAQLELQAVADSGSNSYIDYSSIFNEQYTTDSDLQKDILKLVSDQAATIKDYKSRQLFKYPFLKDVNGWEEDFVLCQMYDFKTSIYHSITSNYPVSKTVPDLIKELSSINPKTDSVDATFDQSRMTFNNTDKSLNFTCAYRHTGEKLNFTIDK